MFGSPELGWLDHLCDGTVHSAPYQFWCDINNVIPLCSVNDTRWFVHSTNCIAVGLVAIQTQFHIVAYSKVWAVAQFWKQTARVKLICLKNGYLLHHWTRHNAIISFVCISGDICIIVVDTFSLSKYVLSSGLNFCVLYVPSAAQACWPMPVKIHFYCVSTWEWGCKFLRNLIFPQTILGSHKM